MESIVEWLKDKEFTKLGIASFGPLCLNKEDKLYGSITSSPKLKW